MVVEEEGIPVFDLGADEVVGGVPVDGHDGGVVEEDGFGFGEGLHAGGDVGGVFGTAQEGFEFFGAPSGVVVAVAFGPHFQEGGGVEVVTDPAADTEIEIGVVLLLLIGGPLALDDAAVDAEMLFPHRLQGFRFAAAGVLVGG